MWSNYLCPNEVTNTHSCLLGVEADRAPKNGPTMDLPTQARTVITLRLAWSLGSSLADYGLDN